MFEIVPNWHPIFVHFTVALLSVSVGLFAITPFTKPPLQEQWLVVARWALWFGAGFTVLTGLTGLYAYNTVAHDTPSHIAMTDHRNWAIATMTLFFAATIWSIVGVRRQLKLGGAFVITMVIAGGLLGSTAWRGGEIVYRYGLGVMSLPEVAGEGHAHEHADGGGHGHDNETPSKTHNGDSVDDHHGEIENKDVTHSSGDTRVGENSKTNVGAATTKKDHHDDGHDHEH